jgi:hypothetical protein
MPRFEEVKSFTWKGRVMTPCKWFRYDETNNRFAVVTADYLPLGDVIKTLRVDGVTEPVYIVRKTTAGPNEIIIQYLILNGR